ncbi:NAD-P-binding protein [Rhodocollybia butyracea]|uniref:NAD-P-binding protein n=1 Tax=Rhodocollybia butyracea TaxID=206335 RepID=A0A9P5PTN6_9AGAR|nr:NAD-P-binding protein [Rhodocollybia butyracea]
MTKILLTGVTGYVGGSVLTRFAERPDFDSLDIRCIVRSPEKAERINAIFPNVTSIVGSHSDIPLMAKAASEVDIVIAMADCDDEDAVTGTLQGLKKRFEETGKQPIFINTSGTGVLTDGAGGMYASDIIWDDADPEQMATLQPNQPHRPVDLKVLEADAEGYIKSYIVIPPIIWGIAQGSLFDLGISHKQSILIPMGIRLVLSRGQVGMVGLGRNIWNNVEIHELADFYSILYDALLSQIDLSHGRKGYYFTENGEGSLYEYMKAISEVMFKMNKGKGGEPIEFTEGEIKKTTAHLMGGNTRCRSTLAKALGWTPRKTTQDMLDSIEAEVELTTATL